MKKVSIVLIMFLILLSSCRESPVFETINNQETQENGYIMVDLRGEVKRPGIYQLPVGSLLNELIIMSGGFREKADLSKINLVEVLNKNCQIFVDSYEKIEGRNESESHLINLNTCSKEQLMSIPGIGEAKAKSIIDYRDKVNKYTKIEDLMKVSGIGEKIFSQIKDYVTV